MADTKKMLLPDGREVAGIDVAIEESIERWCDFTLSDGTKLRAKVTIIETQRALNDFDQEGRPMYRMNVQPMVILVSVPDSLKKKEEK